MNGRQMSRQTSAKQTNAETQAWQPNKQMVESTNRSSPPIKTTKGSLCKNDTNSKDNDFVFNLRISQNFGTIQFACHYQRYPK